MEAEASMLGQPIYMVTPQVVGFKLKGQLPEGSTATDLVLVITQILRSHGVVEKFVEFYGEGLAGMSVADRATIANMAPEDGATIGVFPVEAPAPATGNGNGNGDGDGNGARKGHEADGREAATIEHLKDHKDTAVAEMDEGSLKLTHGDVVIAAITSCTNTSNPSVMIAAGLLAKKAVERGLMVDPSVKTSLAPGSRVVTEYLEKTGLQPFLNKLGFNLVGYGCTTCLAAGAPLVLASRAHRPLGQM